MATAAAEPVFVDTNILVFANTATAPFHAEAQAALRSFAGSEAELWISRQILREYLATLSRAQSFTAPVPAASLCADVLRFQAQFQIAEDGPAVTGNLLTLLGSTIVGGKQVHDANIVATLQAYAIPALLTHNVKDFERFGQVVRIEGI